MLKRYRKVLIVNFLSIMLAATAIILTQLISYFPWWSFVLTAMLLGASARRFKVELSLSFVGFFSGFIVWCGGNLYFQLLFNGSIMTRVAAILSVPPFLLFILSGIIGGFLTLLAAYIGNALAGTPGIEQYNEANHELNKTKK